MGKAPRSRHVSRKQQSRVEKEHTQRRVVLITTILVAVLVVGVIVYGVLDQTVLQLKRPVAKVEGQKISLEDFQIRARYDRYQLIQNNALLEQYKSLFSFDQSSADYYNSLIQQNVSLLNNTDSLGNQVIQELVNDHVIAIQAGKLGITVTEDEVTQAIQEAFGYYKNGTPTPAPTGTPYSTATYTSQQLTLEPYTATPTLTETPTATGEVTAAPAVTTESTAGPTAEGAAATPTTEGATAIPAATAAPTSTSSPTATATGPTPTASATVTPFPTETPYTEEGFNTTYQNYVNNLETEAQFNSDEFRAIFRSRLLYDKVLAEVTKDIPATTDYIWARHILVATEDEAKAVIDRLNKSEDFAKLAAELSTDTSNKDKGGDLGWFTKGSMVAEFENAAFALTEIGQISAPVQTTYGWHVIQLLGKETRPMTSDQLSQAKQTAFSDWLDGVKKDMKIETYENWKTHVPTIPTTPAQYQQ